MAVHEVPDRAPALVRGVDVGPEGAVDVDRVDPVAGVEPGTLEPVELE
ncbi:MAG TPA: hypothetical protein VFX51_21455 [Solirubrobacteraceae bacterium]|nr:hypothetical protein [Solirubrobacteraceae bacterium]